MRRTLGVPSLKSKRFLDVGCGSGLFSLAARRLGATVHSFDFDPSSVACTTELRSRYFPSDQDWHIEQGSVLDQSYVGSLGLFDVVYSWGVLHHTGALVQALDNVLIPLAPGGIVCLALYNDQGWISGYWSVVKRLFNTHVTLRYALIGTHLPYLVLLRATVRQMKGKHQLPRGMSLWYDMIDWLGGYPFEVCTPRKVMDFAERHELILRHSVLCGRRLGCNEFVFENQGRREPGDG